MQTSKSPHHCITGDLWVLFTSSWIHSSSMIYREAPGEKFLYLYESTQSLVTNGSAYLLGRHDRHHTGGKDCFSKGTSEKRIEIVAELTLPQERGVIAYSMKF